MPATLLTGPANGGQSLALLDRISTLCQRDPFARVVILTASRLQTSAWRRRLAERRLGVAIPVLNFYELNAELLTAAGIALRELGPAARLQILKRVLADRAEAGHLRHFGAIATTPGFRAALSSLIFELKQQRLDEIRFRDAIFDRGPKFDDLQLLYEDYQTSLRETQTADHEGMGWRALGELERRPDLFTPLDLLAVDGFDQFSPLQAGILSALAGRSRETLISLPLEHGNPAYARFEQTGQRLRSTFAERGVPLTEKRVAAESPRPRALHHVREHLFALDPPQEPIVADSLTLLEAPDRSREVRALARRVKRLLQQGNRPDDVAVLFSSLEPWADLVRETFREFDLPLALTNGVLLSRAPVVVALLRALDAFEQRFARHTILDLWTSPYIEPAPLSAAQVRLASLLAGDALVTAGREAWRRALSPTDWSRNPDDPDAREPLVNHQDPQTLAELRAALDAFFQTLTPPVRGTPNELARWVEQLIGADPEWQPGTDSELAGSGEREPGSLHIIRRIRAMGEPGLAAGDLAALDSLSRLLRGYAEGAALAGVTEVEWSQFRTELETLLARTTFRVEPFGGVLVASIFEARGQPRRHVLIGGLNEGEFPPPPPPDPLFNPKERAELEEEGILLPADIAARDRAAFLEAATLATESLTLSRTYLDAKGNEWPPSSFWTSMVELFEDRAAGNTQRLPIGEVPDLEEVASPSEWLVAAAVALRESGPGAEPAHNALLADPHLAIPWRTALCGHRIEHQREGPGPHGSFEGVVRDEALLAELRRQLRGRSWSASTFNDLGACGFRFFARRLVGIEAPEELEDGPDIRQIGSIQHEILEHVYRRLAQQGLPVIPDTIEEVLAVLEQEAERLLESAPQRHRFHATSLWPYLRAEITRRLRRLLVWEAEQHAGHEAPPRPYRVEVPFGFGGAAPLRLSAPWGPISVIGLIDRVDRLPDGLVITDYKSGGSPIPVEEMRTARNVQMAIYIRAAQQLFEAEGLPVRKARFVHLRTPKTSGVLDGPPDEIEQLVAEAESALGKRLAAAWDGNFAVSPDRFENEKCVRYCEYATMCRVHRGSRKHSGREVRTQGAETADG